MTLDDLPFAPADSAPNLGAAPPRRCRRHQWEWAEWRDAADQLVVLRERCVRCHKYMDAAASRRGRNNRLRGKRIERTEMRRAGRHTGNAGGADDGLSEDGLFAFQAKSRASARFPSWMTAELDKLRTARQGKVPVLVVIEAAGRGVRGRRIAVVEWPDWLDLHNGGREP